MCGHPKLRLWNAYGKVPRFSKQKIVFFAAEKITFIIARACFRNEYHILFILQLLKIAIHCIGALSLCFFIVNNIVDWQYCNRQFAIENAS